MCFTPAMRSTPFTPVRRACSRSTTPLLGPRSPAFSGEYTRQSLPQPIRAGLGHAIGQRILFVDLLVLRFRGAGKCQAGNEEQQRKMFHARHLSSHAERPFAPARPVYSRATTPR
jgi:hypothetical protein